jgi:heme/copper-type cytochrome/quinol oxidase subunit 3
MEASTHGLEPEPREWQSRALYVGARLWCGALSFFFLAFLFAYFYLRALNTNHSWKIGAVNPSMGLGVSIMALFLLSAVLFRVGSRRPDDTLSTGVVALVLAILAIVLQFVEFTTLGFGAESGAYASVFIGWTSTYAIVAIGGVYWIETQLASLWRTRREGPGERDPDVLQAGIEACSFVWAWFVAIGVIAYVILYLV